ncbi:MAG: pimeloyl-ACP methyl ester carboxylesterase [Candidatus Poriferisodalaceae bacterium]|jgi:pimeloyl-ACP methyl ester carboxylesterase
MTRFDQAVGRYAYLELDGQEHRVYFEESGSGVPLLMQHTAGAHGAQWRHVLEDPWVTDHFRCIAYDLPYHGKSLPPTGPQWWAETYDLTTEFAMSVPNSLASALDATDPVFMGCSIGGLLALDLARYHPESWRAVIGVEPSLRVGGNRDSMAGFWHPQVSNEFKASAMYGLTAPQSPEELRRETVFVYSQGWPPAFLGDLHYYVEDHDLSEEARHIDTNQVGVHLLTGEYDYSATPAHGQAAHDAIAGSTFSVMEELGHFPMSENPTRFLEHLRPVLAKILEGN